MLYVEDVLLLIAARLIDPAGPVRDVLPGEWYLSFATSVSEHIRNGKPLSTEQSRIVLKMAERMRGRLIRLGDVEEFAIDRLLAEPRHRLPPYKSTSIPKEVRYLGDNKLGFRFKYNEVILKQLRALQDHSNAAAAHFNRDHRIWVVPVQRPTFRMINQIITTHRFHADEATLEYLELCYNSENWPSTFALDTETGVIVANVADNELLACWATVVAGGMVV